MKGEAQSPNTLLFHRCDLYLWYYWLCISIFIEISNYLCICCYLCCLLWCFFCCDLCRWIIYGPGGSKENAVRRAGSRQFYSFSLRICSISIGKHTRHSFGIFYLQAGFGLFRGGGATGVDTWQIRGNEGQP